MPRGKRKAAVAAKSSPAPTAPIEVAAGSVTGEANLQPAAHSTVTHEPTLATHMEDVTSSTPSLLASCSAMVGVDSSSSLVDPASIESPSRKIPKLHHTETHPIGDNIEMIKQTTTYTIEEEKVDALDRRIDTSGEEGSTTIGVSAGEAASTDAVTVAAEPTTTTTTSSNAIITQVTQDIQMDISDHMVGSIGPSVSLCVGESGESLSVSRPPVSSPAAATRTIDHTDRNMNDIKESTGEGMSITPLTTIGVGASSSAMLISPPPPRSKKVTFGGVTLADVISSDQKVDQDYTRLEERTGMLPPPPPPPTVASKRGVGSSLRSAPVGVAVTSPNLRLPPPPLASATFGSPRQAIPNTRQQTQTTAAQRRTTRQEERPRQQQQHHPSPGPEPFLSIESQNYPQAITDLLSTPLFSEFLDPLSGLIDPRLVELIQQYDPNVNYFTFEYDTNIESVAEGVQIQQMMMQELIQGFDDFESLVSDECRHRASEIATSASQQLREFQQRCEEREKELLGRDEKIIQEFNEIEAATQKLDGLIGQAR